MDGQAYLRVIERRLERYFDKKALVQGGLQLDLVAELHASDEGYFLVHSIKTTTSSFIIGSVNTGPALAHAFL